MESQSDNPPLIAIVGETASGKTALAVRLAQQFGGEIICADSRTIYRGMDIGTAKPTIKERGGVPHHMLDVVDPGEHFSAASFQQRTQRVIAEISDRGKIPFLVGGTGLYVDAVLFNFSFAKTPDPVERQRLADLSVIELQTLVREQGIPMPTNNQNPRHLIRALETGGTPRDDTKLRPNTLVMGLQIDADVLRAKLTARVDAMVAAGFTDEVRQLGMHYGWDAPGLQAPGYKAFRQYLEGTCSLQEAKALFVQNDWKLAKRQRTWFKRNKSIHWVRDTHECVDLVTTFLNK